MQHRAERRPAAGCRRRETSRKLLVWLVSLCVTWGCGPHQSEVANRPAEPRAADRAAPARPLRVAVIDDRALEQAMAREWQANAQEPLEFQSLASDQVTATPLAADVIVFPSCLLGQLIGDRQIIPWPTPGPAETAASPTPAGLVENDYDWNDVFPWLRRQELRWGKRLYGVSFGSPQLLLLYRADLLTQWGLAPPTTWQQYSQVVASLQPHLAGSGGNGPRYATLEPLRDGWAARTLLARAASYARHPNQYSALFQFTTMKPWIDQPPFVRALEEMQRCLEPLPAEATGLGVDELVGRLLSGDAVMALGWPSAGRAAPAAVAGDATFAIAPLPGATEVYQMADQTWQPRPAAAHPSVPLLGSSGRIGAVARRARSIQAAQSFLLWVTRAENSVSISSQSPATTLFRQAHAGRPRAWVDAPLASAAGAFAAAMLQNQQALQVLMSPRIPGQARYLQILDDAVREAVARRQDAQTVLTQVAEDWTALTDQLGRETQRKAYEASLGIEF